MKIATNQTAKTIHFARRPAGKVKNEPLTGPESLSEQGGQLCPGRYRRLAGEVARRRRRRARRRPSGGRRAGAGWSPPRGRRRGRGGAGTRRGRRRARLAEVVADERHLADRRELEVERPQQVGEGLRVAAGGLARRAAGRPRPGARTRRSPVSAAKRSRPSAAALLPDGIGWSPISLRRAISSSWSLEVEKKPPRSGSPKRSIIVSASSRACSNQRRSKVAS